MRFHQDQPRSPDKSQPYPKDSVMHGPNPLEDSNGHDKMVTRWALPASVCSGTPVTGISEEAKEKTAVRAMLLGPAGRTGMLQLDLATWGQASKGINCLGTSSCRSVGCVLLDLPCLGEPPPHHREPSSPYVPLQGTCLQLQRHDPDLPKSPSLQHSVTSSQLTTIQKLAKSL